MNSSNSGNSFQQEMTSSTGAPQLQWKDQKLLLFPGDSSSNDTSFKQMSRTTTTSTGFSLDHHHEFSPQYSSGGDGSTVTCQQGGGGGLANSSSFQVDSAALYGSPSAILLQGLFGPDQNTYSSSSLAYNSPNYGVMMSTTSNEVLAPSSNWSSNSTKLPQFLRTSPPKQPPTGYNSPLQFSNNAPFWNAPEAAATKDVRSSFFSTLQPQFPSTTFDEKPKVI